MKAKVNSKQFSKRFGFLGKILGYPTWVSPPWWSKLCHLRQAKPKLFWSLLFSLTTVLFASAYIFSLPAKPSHQIESQVQAPGASYVDAEQVYPQPLRIEFGLKGKGVEFSPKSVAALALVGKKIGQYVQVKPAIEGDWEWNSDQLLYFNPKNDWPAGQKFQLQFSPELFRKDIVLQSLKADFATLPFQAEIQDFIFQQDPKNAKQSQATATLKFSYAVDPLSLDRALSLRLDGKAYPFNLSYDKLKRKAYLISQAIPLVNQSQVLTLSIDKDLKPQSGTGRIAENLSQTLSIPDQAHYFKIQALKGMIVHSEQDKAMQVLTLESSLGVQSKELNPAIEVYQLPTDYPATADMAARKNYEWHNPGEISSAILAQSKKLSLKALPSDREYATLHSYQIQISGPSYLFVKIAKGISGFGGYRLDQDYYTVIKAPEYPKEIRFLHGGALMSLAGEKKLSVLVRGLPAVKFELARVLPDALNQLVTQSSGEFNHPNFLNASFNQNNIAQIYSEIRNFSATDSSQEQYTALDFEKYLAKSPSNPAGPKGLFLINAQGYDETNQQLTEPKAKRLILISDIGIVLKDNLDGSHEVFAQSISTGRPIAGAAVEVLAKNGLTLLKAKADETGHVHFPSLANYTEDREPVAYLARQDEDVSFIPFKAGHRQLNYSRFDLGGITTSPEQDSLSAYVFSDRGIYRPGDKAHLGFIVKQGFAKKAPEGVQLIASVTDPEGKTVLDEKLTLDALGFHTLDFKTEPSSPTGQYDVSLYLVKTKNTSSLLGSTNIALQEFRPDTMKIQAEFSPSSKLAWLNPSDLQVLVKLKNLFGTAATERRLTAKVILEPQSIHFDAYKDYQFADLSTAGKKKKISELLPEQKSNAEGEALFKLPLESLRGFYNLRFVAEGYEAEAGRSVSTEIQTLVSPTESLLGYKPDGDLHFIPHNSARTVQLLALNSRLQGSAVPELICERYRLENVSTLVKQPNGSYRYQTVQQSQLEARQNLALDSKGLSYPLATDKLGQYQLKFLDKAGNTLNQIAYTVVGSGSQAISKNAELDLKLDKTQYKPGETMQLQIAAAYPGAGLMTIEQDGVKAWKWFSMDSNSSLQSFTLPEDLKGNAYINVLLLRDWNADTIFISPLSYSVQGFEIDHENQDLAIDLKVPEKAKPGDKLQIEYKAKQPAKAVIFAIDEGILQVARYKAPDPLAFFFAKHALEVETQQTLDQVLPKYLYERELSSVAGDGALARFASHLNPFKRKAEAAVVYWSGIIDVDPTAKSLSYTIPDYFNGNLRWMAVAVAAEALGSTSKSTEVKADLVISPSLPTFLAPKDQFELAVTVANNYKGQSNAGPVKLRLKTGPRLSVKGPEQQNLLIPEGQEKTAHFILQAGEELGDADIQLEAELGSIRADAKSSLSIRPLSPYQTSIQSFVSRDPSKTVHLTRQLYPEHRDVHVQLSTDPLILVHGLQQYLEKFPFSCTEQLTSRAFSLMATAKLEQFNADKQKIQSRMESALNMLMQRQRSDGSFSYWPDMQYDADTSWVSVYAFHFLTEARAAGYKVPETLYSQAQGYLNALVNKKTENLEMARTQAYALYLLTRNTMLTTNALLNLQAFYEKQPQAEWKQDIGLVYIAASYSLLKADAEAEKCLALYQPSTAKLKMGDFDGANISKAQYLNLLAQHFPKHLERLGDPLVLELAQAINPQEISTIFAAYASLALSHVAEPEQGISTAGLLLELFLGDSMQQALSQQVHDEAPILLPPNTKRLDFKNPQQKRFFAQLSESGFDRQPATVALSQGLEILRDYQDSEGKEPKTVALGQELKVHVRLRSTDLPYVGHLAIIDLLPAGFELVRDSLQRQNLEYVDIREDRIVFFVSVADTVTEFTYKIKATSPGQFAIPAIYAESMYNPELKANGLASSIQVETAK